MVWNRYYDYFPRSQAHKAKGGIKAQSKRGNFGQSWWARRWIDVLESFDIGARLGRGRSYARKGQVVSIDINKGLVTAKVQGSRRQPYKVAIEVRTLSNASWKKLSQSLSRQAIFAAKLLSGEMPENIEEAFNDAKLTLFPSKRGDLKTDCSCPDWSNPCKHIAAVYYLLGEEFDRDPFLIFKLRGMERNELLSLLRGQRVGKGKVLPKPTVEEEEKPVHPAVPLPANPRDFWGQRAPDYDTIAAVSIPPVAAGLPRRLGKVPLWRGEEKFLSAMETIYREASPIGMDVFLGERGLTKNSRWR